MSNVTITHLTEAQALARPSQMLDYVITIRNKKGKFVKAIRYQGASGHSMWDYEKDWTNEYPKSEGYTVDW
jgi:hypothetical protein